MQKIMSAVLAGMLALAGGCSTAGPKAPHVKIEFRAAQNRPGSGLTEMVAPRSDGKVYVSSNALLTDADIESAALKPNRDGASRIEVMFTEEGRRKFSKATTTLIGRPLVILIDGKAIAAPIVRQKITGRRAIIEGSFSQEEAKRIADSLNAGK